MTDTLKQLKKKLESIRLSAHEREGMRSILQDYVAHKPLAQPAHVPARRSWFVMHRFATAVAVVLVLAGGGAASAAEGTVPGDVLYPVKVSVTEPLRAAFADTPEERAAWEIERAERRLAEAATLAYENKLTDERRQVIETKLQKHVADAQVHVEGEAATEEDVHATIDAVFAVHENVLTSLDTDEQEPVGRLLAVVRSQRKETRLARADRFAAKSDTSTEALTIAVMTEPVLDDEDEIEEEEQDTITAQTGQAVVTEELPSITEQDIALLEERLKIAEQRFVAALDSSEETLATLPDDTQESLAELIEDGEGLFGQVHELLLEGKLEQATETLHEALQATRRIEAGLRATKHIRELDPGLWPIDIAPPQEVLDAAAEVLGERIEKEDVLHEEKRRERTRSKDEQEVFERRLRDR